jgi:hypothetical protein
MSTQYSTRRRASDGLPARDHHGGTHRPAEGGVGHADPPHARELLVSVLPVLLTPHHTRLTSRHVSRHATSGATHSIIHSELLPRSYLPRWNATLQPTPYTATISITPRITGPPPTPHRAPRGHPHRAGVRSISTFNMHLCSWDARWHRRNRLLTCRNSYHPAARAPSIWRLEVLGRAWAPMMLARRVDGPRVMAAVSQ